MVKSKDVMGEPTIMNARGFLNLLFVATICSAPATDANVLDTVSFHPTRFPLTLGSEPLSVWHPAYQILKPSPFHQNLRILPPLPFDTQSKSFKLGYIFEPEYIGGRTGPIFVKPSFKLRPWFDDCDNRIKHALEQEPRATTFHGRIACIFLLEPDGNISDLFAVSDESSKSMRDVFMKIVKRAAPFNRPVDELLHKERIQVEFRRYPQVEVSMDLRSYRYQKDPDEEFQQLKQAQ
jgi:hypothetical protein